MSIKNLTKYQFKFTSIENSSPDQNSSEEIPMVTTPSPEDKFQDNKVLSKIYPNQSSDQVLSSLFDIKPESKEKRNYFSLPVYFIPTFLAITLITPFAYIVYEGFTDPDSFPKFLESLEIKSKRTPNP
jgi:hypothetical protein